MLNMSFCLHWVVFCLRKRFFAQNYKKTDISPFSLSGFIEKEKKIISLYPIPNKAKYRFAVCRRHDMRLAKRNDNKSAYFG